MAINIGMKEARQRLRDRLCLNCSKPQTNKELNSCNDSKCVTECREIYKWTQKVVDHLAEAQETTYVGYSA
jgi:hypothetical protein